MSRPPRHLDRDHALGALVGLAVGDALGTTLEFQRLPPQPFTPLVAGPHREVTGGGPFRVAPGQVTDDTQMAVALARTLMERGDFDGQAVGEAYFAWSREAFDIGNQTSNALTRIGLGTPATSAGRETWLATGKKVAGNGSLMRTTPIAIFFAADDARRVEVSRLDAAITHYDPRCQLACAAFNGAIAAAARGHVEPAAMLAAARADLALAHAQSLAAMPADAAEIDQGRAAIEADLAAAEAADPGLYGGEVDLARVAGFVRVAFRLAFWHLVHTRSYEAALVDTVNRGGDADTNGAIVGALLGASLGAAAIPAAWQSAVRDALAGKKGPWATRYHPRELYALIADG